MKQTLGTILIILLVLAGIVFYTRTDTNDVGMNEEDEATTSQMANTILQTSEKRSRLTVGDSCLDLGIADTRQLRARGLSGEPGIEENQGLLFAYADKGDYGFWMKEMNFPIDIIWLDADFEIISIKEKAQPESYPETFFPDEPAQFVLELSAGRSEELGLTPGDELAIAMPATDIEGCGDISQAASTGTNELRR